MTQVSKTRGPVPKEDVIFQMDGQILKLPEAKIKRAIGARRFKETRTVHVAAYVSGVKLVLQPQHLDTSPNGAARKQQHRSLLKAWKSSPAGRQYYISTASILRALKLDREDVAGKTYPARVTSSGTIVVTIGRQKPTS